MRAVLGFRAVPASRSAGWMLALLLVGPSTFGVEPTGSVERAPGLQKAVFRTPDGSVTVHLPDDARAGDSLSGVVVVEPEGDSEKKRQKSQDRLDGLVVEMEGQRNEVKRGLARWTIPAAVAVVLRLVDPKGRELARTSVPVQCASPHEFTSLPGEPEDLTETVLNLKPVRLGTKPPPAGPAPGQKPPAVKPEDFRLPATGQTGRSVTCDGPFDGDLDTTSLTLDGKPVRLLAESPRRLVFESPQDTTGKKTLRLEERGVESEASYRNVAVRLSAGTTSLTRGQTTTLGIAVEGLEGLAEEVPLHLQKSGVVQMAGGDEQVIRIQPSDVNATGRCSFERTLTGLAAGAFNVLATVQVPQAAITLTEPKDGAWVGEPRPRFAWKVEHAPAGMTYAVKLVEGEPGQPLPQLLLGSPHHVGTNIASTAWTYPAEAPPLRPGAFYGVVVKGLVGNQVVALSGPAGFLFKWETPITYQPNPGFGYGQTGNLNGRPCTPPGAKKTAQVKRTHQCRICDAVVTPMDWTPGDQELYKILTLLLKAVGAGKGVNLGEALAGCMSLTAARSIWIKLCWTVVDYEYEYQCVNDKWELVGIQEKDRGDLFREVQLRNPTLNQEPTWFPYSTANELARAVEQAKALAGCQ